MPGGFPSSIISGRYNDPYLDYVEANVKVKHEQVLDINMVSTNLELLRQLIDIRGSAEVIFTELLEELNDVNKRIDRTKNIMTELKHRSFDIKKLCENTSPESFCSVASSEILSMCDHPEGALFNRSKCPKGAELRRETAQKIIPLDKFNRFYPCLEIDHVDNAEEWICSQKYSNPRLFFDDWLREEHFKQEQQRQERKIMLKKLRKEREMEIKKESSVMISPIKRYYVNDHGERVVRKIGVKKAVKGYNHIHDIGTRKVMEKKIEYGKQAAADQFKIEREEAFKMNQGVKAEVIEVVEHETPELSFIPPPNIHRPGIGDDHVVHPMAPLPPSSPSENQPPQEKQQSFYQQQRGMDHLLPEESQLLRAKTSTRSVLDQIRKGSSLNETKRPLPSLPDNAQFQKKSTQEQMVYQQLSNRGSYVQTPGGGEYSSPSYSHHFPSEGPGYAQPGERKVPEPGSMDDINYDMKNQGENSVAPALPLKPHRSEPGRPSYDPAMDMDEVSSGGISALSKHIPSFSPPRVSPPKPSAHVIVPISQPIAPAPPSQLVAPSPSQPRSAVMAPPFQASVVSPPQPPTMVSSIPPAHPPSAQPGSSGYHDMASPPPTPPMVPGSGEQI